LHLLRKQLVTARITLTGRQFRQAGRRAAAWRTAGLRGPARVLGCPPAGCLPRQGAGGRRGWAARCQSHRPVICPRRICQAAGAAPSA